MLGNGIISAGGNPGGKILAALERFVSSMDAKCDKIKLIRDCTTPTDKDGGQARAVTETR